MSPITHLLSGWVLASAAGCNRRERTIVTVAAVIPDVDGLGAVAEWLTRNSQHPVFWFSQYHHRFHTLLFAIIVAAAAYLLSLNKFLPALLAFTAFHLHLVEDLVGSRGPEGFNWPIPYLSPFTNRFAWSWSGPWALNAWPNLILTAGLVVTAVWIAVQRGHSPVELFSMRAEDAVVSALRRRFRTADVS